MGEPYTVCVLTDECIHTRVCTSRRRRIEIQARGRLEYAISDTLLVEHDTEELADAIAQAVTKSGLPAERIALVVPLQWCFTHVLSSPGRKATTQSLAYDLEQYLPLPLEELTCAFVPVAPDRVLAVAIPTQPTAQLLAALNVRGVDVQHLAVDAITAAATFHKSGSAGGVIIRDVRWARIAAGLSSEETPTPFVFALDDDQPLAGAVNDQVKLRFPESTPQADDWVIVDLSGNSSSATPLATGDHGSNRSRGSSDRRPRRPYRRHLAGSAGRVHPIYPLRAGWKPAVRYPVNGYPWDKRRPPYSRR